MLPTDYVQVVVVLRGGGEVVAGPMQREQANQLLRGWYSARELVRRGEAGPHQAPPPEGFESVEQWLREGTYATNFNYGDGAKDCRGQENFAGDAFAWSEVAGMHMRELHPCQHHRDPLQAKYLELQTRLMEQELERRRREEGWREGADE